MTGAAREQYEVAIMGGGLAGLCLSIQLAGKGISAILFEKEKYPFHKVCGEYISMESWPFLETLGIPLSSLNLPLVSKLRVTSHRGTALDHALKPGGFGISRYLLDSLLADLARSKGVMVADGTKVNSFAYEGNSFHIDASGLRVSAGVLVGAHGKRSNADKLLNRRFISKPLQDNNNYIAVKYHVKADLPADTIELHNFRDGYCGISQVEGDVHCLCYLTTARNLRAGGGIPGMEREILMKNPYLRRYLQFDRVRAEPVTISQVSFERKPPVESHVLMAGDSAGLIAPVCGNGMSMAMHASKCLAELIVQYAERRISRDQMEERYAKEWNSRFSGRIRAGVMLQRLMGGEALTEATIRLMRSSGRLSSFLIGLTHGSEF